MLSLFRKNDPFLNIVLIILLVVVRLLYTFLGQVDLNNLSQEQSYLISQVFGMHLNHYGHIWVSTVFVMVNMLLINHIVRTNQAFDENNYLAGFIYFLIVSSGNQFYVLNGGLIASTCLLLALSLILGHVKQRASEENIFFTGVLLGLSVLFYAPMSLFLPLCLLIYVFYTRTIPRRYVLATFGFCFPFIVTFSIGLFGKQGLTLSFFFKNLFSAGISSLEPISLLFLGFPFLLTFIKMLSSFGGTKMTNHQIHFHRIMFLLFLAAIYILFADTMGKGFIWVFIIPATYFISRILLEAQKKWLRSALFLLLVAHLIYPYLVATNF